jgi:hypothetical protein
MASEIGPGDSLELIDGDLAIIGSVGVAACAEKTGDIETYNLEVDEFHTYFVGIQGVWTHNRSLAPCEKLAQLFSRRLTDNGGKFWTAFRSVLSNSTVLKKADDINFLSLKFFNDVRKRYFDEAIAGEPPPWLNLTKQVFKKDSPGLPADLRRNMEAAFGFKKPSWFSSHHIVEKAANPEAREIIERAGLNIDEAANGMWLPRGPAIKRLGLKIDEDGFFESVGPPHDGAHTNKYHEAVLDRLRPLDGKGASVIREELQLIAKELAEGKFPW